MKLSFLPSLAVAAILPLAALASARPQEAAPERPSALALLPAQEPAPAAEAPEPPRACDAKPCRAPCDAKPCRVRACDSKPAPAAVPAPPTPLPPLGTLKPLPSMPGPLGVIAPAPRVRLGGRSRTACVGSAPEVGYVRVPVATGGVVYSRSKTDSPGRGTVRVVDGGGKDRVFVVGDGDDSPIRIEIRTSSTCSKDSACCPCGKGSATGDSSNSDASVVWFDGSRDRPRVLRLGRGRPAPSVDDFEELMETRREEMEAAREQWEERYEAECEALESAFDEMEEESWDEWEASWDDWEDTWAESWEDWEASWDEWQDSCEDWQDEFEDSWDSWEDEFQATWEDAGADRREAFLQSRSDGDAELPEEWEDFLDEALDSIDDVQWEQFEEKLDELRGQFEEWMKGVEEDSGDTFFGGPSGTAALYASLPSLASFERPDDQQRTELEARLRELLVDLKQELADLDVGDEASRVNLEDLGEKLSQVAREMAEKRSEAQRRAGERLGVEVRESMARAAEAQARAKERLEASRERLHAQEGVARQRFERELEELRRAAGDEAADGGRAREVAQRLREAEECFRRAERERPASERRLEAAPRDRRDSAAEVATTWERAARERERAVQCADAAASAKDEARRAVAGLRARERRASDRSAPGPELGFRGRARDDGEREGVRLDNLQSLVEGMQNEIESLREDLRDLRSRVEALSKRELR